MHRRSVPPRSATLLVVVLALLLTGCGPDTPSQPLSSPTVAPVTGPVAFHLQLGAGQTLALRSPDPGGCPGVTARVDLGKGRSVTLVAYSTDCPAGDNAQPGNGRHGVYRSAADIPDDRVAGEYGVATALGMATAFNQPYYECTNSCKNYTEPVAIIALDHPGDPKFPSLTVYSEKGSIGSDGLNHFLQDQLRT